MLSGIKWVFRNQDLRMFGLKITSYMSNFLSLEAVGQGEKLKVALFGLRWLIGPFLIL